MTELATGMESRKMILMNLLLLLLLLSRFSRVQLCATPETAAHQTPPSLDSPGKNTGVGCHFLLQCMKVKSQSEVTQSCLTLSDPMDCSLPGSSVHGFSRHEYWSGVPLPSPGVRNRGPGKQCAPEAVGGIPLKWREQGERKNKRAFN